MFVVIAIIYFVFVLLPIVFCCWFFFLLFIPCAIFCIRSEFSKSDWLFDILSVGCLILSLSRLRLILTMVWLLHIAYKSTEPHIAYRICCHVNVRSCMRNRWNCVTLRSFDIFVNCFHRRPENKDRVFRFEKGATAMTTATAPTSHYSTQHTTHNGTVSLFT